MSNHTESTAAVTATELDALKADRERLARLRDELGALAIELHERERDVIRRIESGARVEGAAEVITHRCERPAWLALVAGELDAETIRKVEDAWPIAVWKELQIA